jgi:hypothetical protein
MTLFVGSCVEQDKRDSQIIDRGIAKTESEDLRLPDTVFFWSHAAPVFFQNCTPCHHSEGAGPFPLETYADIKKRLKTIKLAISDGFMPPWPADPEFRRFKDEKVLSELEEATILKWIEQGGLEGDKSSDAKGFRLSQSNLLKPDTVILFPDTVFLRADNLDKFRLAKIAFELPRDTILKAIAFKPGNKQLVHHVNGHLINYNPANKQDVYSGEWISDAEVGSSLDAYKKMEVFHDDGSYPPMLVSAFNYLPGVEPAVYPDDLGSVFISKKGAFILNTLHYGPSAIDTFDISEIELYYASERPKRPLRELHMGTLGITPVEPNFVIYADSICEFHTEYTVPEDISILTINPHMHLLGSTFKAYAVAPQKRDTIPLIHIPEWDFRWQYFYTFEQMLKIPKGYTIRVEASFDNTIHNPYNPNVPPKTLFEGGKNMKTTDEMFQFFITYVPYQIGDENIKL